MFVVESNKPQEDRRATGVETEAVILEGIAGIEKRSGGRGGKLGIRE